MKAFQGSQKLETRHEEVVRLTDEIFQLEKSIADLEYSVKQYEKNDSNKYKEILNLQKVIEENSIKLEKALLIDSDSQYTLRNTLNTDKESLRTKRNDYDTNEREELKTRYDYLKEIARTEIRKYTNLKENKQDLLAKVTAQIPVNFIIDKDNVTLGFNADGNLVTLFDSYDNQVAIVYENGKIEKVVDAENREIVFEYQYKSSTTGRLVSVTDFKGHKTSFNYGTNGNYEYLKKVEYPNGETSEFTYTPEGLLNEMLSPSETGIRLLFNADKKVSSILELTKATKIDKKGVYDGTETAEEVAVLTYNERTTIVRDTKKGDAESNLFDPNGNLLRVETMKHDKLAAFTTYDESSISQTSKRYNFVMTADDDIVENGISGIDIISPSDENSVSLDGFAGAKHEWQADLNMMDSIHTDYILCASATAPAAEKTPMRKKTEYCKNHCDHDMNSTYRRFEYKVHVDYAGKEPTPPTSVYTPIETGDRINKLFLNTSKILPSSNVTDFFGQRIKYPQVYLYYFYPIFGEGSFSIDSIWHQVYYTAEDYPLGGGVQFGCALKMDNTVIWCNQLYANKNNISAGWHKSSIDLSTWGPINVYNKQKIHNWGQVFSKNTIFHNGCSFNPNYAKDNQDPDIDEFIAGFNYKFKERQHVALPITLRKENGKPIMPKKITVTAHFKQSQGEAVFERPNLIKGKVAYELLDESGNAVFESVSDPEKIAVNDQTGGYSSVKSSVATEYNENNSPTRKSTVYTYTTARGSSEKTVLEKWFYNPQGRVIEYWNYVEGEELTSGIDITETVYDKRGNAVKSFTYNSLDASTKFYSEQELAENGRVFADLDETGAHKTKYEYDDVTGIVKTAATPNGGKFSYAHDTNTDEVIAITQSTEEGEENTTNRVYTAGYLTELVGGDNTVNYHYDRKGRTSAIYLNDTVPYAEYTYEDRGENGTADTVTAALAPTDGTSRYIVSTEQDKDGNLLKLREGKTSLSLSDSIVNAYFGREDKDRKGLLKTSEDKIAGTKTEYSYNSLRQPLSATVRDTATNDVISTVTAEYDEFGQIAKRRIVSGSYTQEYGYRYKDDFAKEPESVSMPYGLISTRITDVNGRLKEQTLSGNGTPLAKEYYYFRKHGDHGTNQISSVRYGERKNGQFVIKDGVSYSYDECGNITEIKENGKLTCHYEYDKLNRLIREDNAKFGTTSLYAYDNNGNILSKRETAFTLKETQKIAEFTYEREYSYDAEHPDRLISFGDENILGYDSIGNPSEYRGKTLTWRKGRQLAGVKNSLDTITFAYDANGRRIGKNADGEHTKYVYAGDMLIREEISDENNIVYLGDDLIAGNNATEGDGIVVDSVNKSVVEYYYGLSGVAGLVYNGVNYYFRRNVQGDITRIYSIDGTLAACYTYDAWGNHKVYDPNGNENVDPNFVGNVNPFRYRGYYYDSETGLYYCGSRYYDPEVGRWINADDISYLDPETINGLNLYSYCFNNPVMMVDDTGNKPKWWQWLLFGIGAALVVTAAVVLTVASGGAATGLIGAIAVGAAKGALIGAAVGSAVGIAGGAIYSSVTGADIGDSILSGFLIGFGGGAIAGAVIGGFGGANGWYNAKALEFTNFGSKEVVVGRSPKYVEIAQQKGATYFHTSSENWNLVHNMKGVGSKGMWRINKAFLKQQIKAGAIFNLTAPSGGYFYAKEFAYIIKHALYFF